MICVLNILLDLGSEGVLVSRAPRTYPSHWPYLLLWVLSIPMYWWPTQRKTTRYMYGASAKAKLFCRVYKGITGGHFASHLIVLSVHQASIKR